MTSTPSRHQIEAWERVGHLAWPALEEETVDGWLVRAAAGVTRRSNSVNANESPSTPMDNAVEAGITWLASRELPPIFRLTPASPPRLEALLESRGLARQEGAIVMVRDLDEETMPAGVEMSGSRSTEWMDVLAGQADRGGPRRQIVERLLDSHTAARGFGLIRDGDQPVSISMTVVAEGHAAIFNMRTIETHRRRGLARKALGGAMAFGRSAGASRALLQVHPANVEALSLYRSAGFQPVYEYWYHQPA